MIISDINAAGASSEHINTRAGLFQLLLNGTWNGATVTLEREVDGNWLAVGSYTDNAYDIIETVGFGKYRLNTTVDGSAPVLTAAAFLYPEPS